MLEGNSGRYGVDGQGKDWGDWDWLVDGFYWIGIDWLGLIESSLYFCSNGSSTHIFDCLCKVLSTKLMNHLASVR